MKQYTIIVSRNQHFYTDGVVREQITKKQAEKLFESWKKQKLTVHRKQGMGDACCGSGSRSRREHGTIKETAGKRGGHRDFPVAIELQLVITNSVPNENLDVPTEI